MTRRGDSVTVSRHNKRRLSERQPQFGHSYNQVIGVLLDRIEAIEKIVGIGLDKPAYRTPVSRDSSSAVEKKAEQNKSQPSE